MMDTTDSQRGQAIVLMAFGVIALIAIVGLAIDGGRLHALRRQAQNAADASAIAGARELAVMISKCQTPTPAGNAQVGQAVLEFARANGVDEASPDGDVEAWYVNMDEAYLDHVRFDTAIPNGSTGVSTRVEVTETTTFMRIVGTTHFSAVGEAMAMTGPLTEFSGGLLPIAVPEIAIQNLDIDEPFYFFDSNGVFCREHDDYCFMGSDNGGPSAQRGWLQLSHIYNVAYWNDGNKPPNRVFVNNMGVAGCKPAPPAAPDPLQTGLKGWASGQCPYPYPIYAGQKGTVGGDFIAGISGVSNSALGEIADPANYTVPGAIVYAPVFDYVYGDDQMRSVFEATPPNGNVNDWMSGTSVYYYHIVGWVAVELRVVDKGAHYIEAAFKDAVIGEGQLKPGVGIGGQCAGPSVIGVTLWK